MSYEYSVFFPGIHNYRIITSFLSISIITCFIWFCHALFLFGYVGLLITNMAELRASNCKLFSSLGRGEGCVCVCVCVRVRACLVGSVMSETPDS